MPLICLKLSATLNKDQQTQLSTKLSSIVAGQLGKPESYMMVILEPQTPILFAQSQEPAAFADIRSVGSISGDQAKRLSRAITDAIATLANIRTDRIYLNFSGLSGAMWGYDGATFG